MFRTCRMKFLIAFLVIRFLKQNICPDSCFFQFPIVFHCSGCYIHIYPADSAIFMFHAINRLNAFQHILNRAIHRVFPRLQCEPLMSHVLERSHLPADFLLRQLLSGNVFILRMIRTVNTSIYTIIRKIKRSKHNNPVSVKIFLNLLCQSINFLILFLNRAVQQYGCFPVGKSLPLPCLIQYLLNQFLIVFVLLRIRQRVYNLLMADKFLRFHGFCIIHSNPPCI